MKCPACGAIVDSMALKCPECGYVFSTESSSSKEIRDSIEQFQNKLLSVDKGENKADLIRSFSLPNTIEGLMSMLTLASSSFESCNGKEERVVSAAWLEKARQAYQTLKNRGGSDNKILSLLEKFSFLEEGKTLPKVKESTKQKRKKSIVKSVVIGVIAAVIIYVFLLVLSNMDVEEPADKTVRQEVMELIQLKEFDKARIKAAEAEYSWDQKELMQMIDEAENK